MPWRREKLPTPVFWPGEWGHKESDTTKQLSLHFTLAKNRLYRSFHYWFQRTNLRSKMTLFPGLNQNRFKNKYTIQIFSRRGLSILNIVYVLFTFSAMLHWGLFLLGKRDTISLRLMVVSSGGKKNSWTPRNIFQLLGKTQKGRKIIWLISSNCFQFFM